MEKPKDNGPLHRKVMGHLGDAAKLVTQGRPKQEVEEVLELVKQFADEHVQALDPLGKAQYQLTLEHKLREVRDSLLSRERFSRVEKGGDRKAMFQKYSASEFSVHVKKFLVSVKQKGSFTVLGRQGTDEQYLSFMDFAIPPSGEKGRNHYGEIAEPKRMLFMFCAFYRASLSRILSLIWTKREKALIEQVLDPVLVIAGFLESSAEIVSPHKLFCEEVASSHGWKEAELNATFGEFAKFMVADCREWVEHQSLDNSLTWEKFVEMALSDKPLFAGPTGAILLKAFQESNGGRRAA